MAEIPRGELSEVLPVADAEGGTSCLARELRVPIGRIDRREEALAIDRLVRYPVEGHGKYPKRSRASEKELPETPRGPQYAEQPVGAPLGGEESTDGIRMRREQAPDGVQRQIRVGGMREQIQEARCLEVGFDGLQFERRSVEMAEASPGEFSESGL